MSAPPPDDRSRPRSSSPRPRSGHSFPASGAHSRPRAAERPTSQSNTREKRSPARIRPRVLFGGVVFVALALVVVHQVHPGKAATTPPRRATPIHYSVGLTRCTFTDPTRETKHYGTGALTPGRVLTTEIRYPTTSPARGVAETPDANPARRHGPFPLVIFAHGYDLTPDTYKNLLDVWVKAGFVVAAPLFPDTNAGSVDALGRIYSPESDDANQPGDVAFLVSTVLADAAVSAPECGIVNGLIKPGGAAITGQSDGAVTVAALAYAAAYQVPGTPIKAVISLSGEKYPAPSGAPTPYASVNGGPPLLVTQSATDTCNPPQNSVGLYDSVVEKHRFFLDILHANHLPPYTGALAAQLPAFKVVSTVTTAFLKDVFFGRKLSHSFLTEGNLQPTVARLTTGSAPVMPTLSLVPSTCYVN